MKFFKPKSKSMENHNANSELLSAVTVDMFASMVLLVITSFFDGTVMAVEHNGRNKLK